LRVAAIDLRGVTVMKAGKELISGVNWRVETGERWVLFGPNGAGKTTLLQVVSTYQFPARGTATILGQRMGRTDVRRLRPRIGYVGPAPAALVRRRLNRQVMEETIRKTLGISCMFMWIILAALCFGAVFDGIGAARAIETLFITNWNLTPWEVLIMMQLSYLFMGMFLDDTAMLVTVAPLYVPLVKILGFDPVWYGVLYTITCQIAYMTPPFGYNLFLMRAMAPPEITLADIYRSISPFVLVMILALALVMIFPQIALWLPGYVYAR